MNRKLVSTAFSFNSVKTPYSQCVFQWYKQRKSFNKSSEKGSINRSLEVQIKKSIDKQRKAKHILINHFQTLIDQHSFLSS